MRTCRQCGKSRKNLWLSKSGLCEKCAWETYKYLDDDEKERIKQEVAARKEREKSSRPTKPFYKRWWFVAAAAVLVIGSIGNLLGIGNDEFSSEPMDNRSAIDTFEAAPEPLPTQDETMPPDRSTNIIPVSEIPDSDAPEVDETTMPLETATPKPTVEPAAESENENRQVYYTKTGSKYHYENPCGNGTYYPCTLDEALANGLSACEKCVLH